MTTPARLRATETPRDNASSDVATLGEFGFLLAGRSVKTGAVVEVRSPYDGSLVAVVHRAGPQDIELAIASAAAAFQTTRKLPTWKRAEILQSIAVGIAGRREELARTIALEAGKPIKTARLEVDRAAFTFQVAAEETKRIGGESPNGTGNASPVSVTNIGA